jgi:hypothetical protein
MLERRKTSWLKVAAFIVGLLTVIGSAATTVNQVENLTVADHERVNDLEDRMECQELEMKEMRAAFDYKLLSEFFMPRMEIGVYMENIDGKLELLLNQR